MEDEFLRKVRHYLQHQDIEVDSVSGVAQRGDDVLVWYLERKSRSIHKTKVLENMTILQLIDIITE